MTCHCFACTKSREEANPGPTQFGQPVAFMRMFLCQTCGNKRCPGAADHRRTCSGSNAPGQPGSFYEAAPNPPELAGTNDHD